MDHSSQSPQESGSDHPGKVSPSVGESRAKRSWTQSSEWSALRRIRFICILLGVVPTLIAIGVLSLRQVAVSRQASASEITVSSLLATENSAAQRVADLGKQLEQDQKASASALATHQAPAITASLEVNEDATASAITAMQAAQEHAQSQLTQADQAHTDAITNLEDMRGVWLVAGAAVLAWAVILGSAYGYMRGEKRIAYEEGQLLAKLSEPEETDNPFELHSLWNSNRDQLNTYHRLVLSYASSSRQTTIITLGVGFGFLLVVAGVSAFADTVATAVAASVVAAAGTALTGFIANAVLRNADVSAKEVLAFFSHPLEVERALSVERIIDGMPSTVKDEAKLMLIRFLTGQANSGDGIRGLSAETSEATRSESP